MRPSMFFSFRGSCFLVGLKSYQYCSGRFRPALGGIKKKMRRTGEKEGAGWCFETTSKRDVDLWHMDSYRGVMCRRGES